MPLSKGIAMYLRFVVAQLDEDSERALGVFHAVRYLRDEGKLSIDRETGRSHGSRTPQSST